MPYIAPESKITCREADDLSKLGPDTGTVIKLIWLLSVFALVLCFKPKQKLGFLVQQVEMPVLGNCFNIQKKYILEIYLFNHRSLLPRIYLLPRITLIPTNYIRILKTYKVLETLQVMNIRSICVIRGQ